MGCLVTTRVLLTITSLSFPTICAQASHVTMSVNKLLSRIVAPKIEAGLCPDLNQQAAFLHDHTCGITSDPLTQFAVVLSALIHDLDHPGVSNGQLINEDPKLAAHYKGKSVAEQNSVDLAWTVLMSPDYDMLRTAVFSTETELRRFRSLLVNSIIATDIFDKELGTLRKNRWNKAFYETSSEDSSREAKSRKATIVIEHLIQASDVAHTMQHWHVYQKWNQRLFDEMMMAYKNGRSDKDPSLGWYQGELWFFDNYVIPLAKKLKDCGVFGVSSDEYLNYATHNRDEWASKGMDVVQQFLDEFDGRSNDVVRDQVSRFLI
jgi:3'5'-cyclic nucleotide phosphodiesterase